MMQTKSFQGGYDKNLCYLIWCEKSKKAAIIDPSVKISLILDYIYKKKLKLEKILITHSHTDHISYLSDFMLNYENKLQVYISDKTKHRQLITNHLLFHNQTLYLGFEKIKCLQTPGHYYDSVCFWVPKNNIIFTGDTMFIGRTGRTIHQGSNIRDLYNSIYNILLKIPKETIIFSGHNYGDLMFDTISNNIKNSSFFSCKNFDEFVLVMANYEKSRKKQ